MCGNYSAFTFSKFTYIYVFSLSLCLSLHFYDEFFYFFRLSAHVLLLVYHFNPFTFIVVVLFFFPKSEFRNTKFRGFTYSCARVRECAYVRCCCRLSRHFTRNAIQFQQNRVVIHFTTRAYCSIQVRQRIHENQESGNISSTINKNEEAEYEKIIIITRNWCERKDLSHIAL